MTTNTNPFILKDFLTREIRYQKRSLMSAIAIRKTRSTYGSSKRAICEGYHTLRGMLIAYAAISPEYPGHGAAISSEYPGDLGGQGFAVAWGGQAIFGSEWATIKSTIESTL